MASEPDLRQMTEPTDDKSSEWDPLAPGTFDDPHGTYQRLRDTCPVAYSDRWGGFYTLTRYDDVVAASRDTETFTATKQTVIPASPRKGLPRLPLQVDPPLHGFYRRGLNVFFKENRIRDLSPAVEALANGLFDRQLQSPTVDFAGGFAGPFTQGSLCLLVGLDLSEAGRLGHLSLEYVRSIQAEDLSKAGGYSREIDQFAIDLVADRKVNPRDRTTDMVSGLLQYGGEERPYTDKEVAGMIRLLLIGGHVVPKNFLSSAVWHLAMDPDLQNRLRLEPALMRTTIEELLRFYSPNQALVRATTREVEIGGRKIPEGCPVALHFLSANRDETVFDGPNTFNPERNPNRHIAFGIGPHVCSGQSLARIQARVALEGLLKRTKSFAVTGTPQWARWTEHGVAELSLSIDLAADGDIAHA